MLDKADREKQEYFSSVLVQKVLTELIHKSKVFKAEPKSVKRRI